MTKVRAGFFSFTEITDPREHRSYNEWHQLDHMPEQFPIGGIAYGQRWVCTPQRRAARVVARPPLDAVHYVTLYLMSEPLDATLQEFGDLGHELARRGRFHQHRRSHLSGPFERIDAQASARVLISAEAVPYRPHRAIACTVETLDAPDTADPGALDDYDDWWRAAHAPALCGLDGVAGVWRFASSPRFDAHVWRPSSCRVSIIWIDGDPTVVSTAIAALDVARLHRSKGITETVLTATFDTITPWQWDWFEGA